MTFSVTQDYTAPSNDTDHAWKLYKESEQQTAIKETFWTYSNHIRSAEVYTPPFKWTAMWDLSRSTSLGVKSKVLQKSVNDLQLLPRLVHLTDSLNSRCDVISDVIYNWNAVCLLSASYFSSILYNQIMQSFVICYLWIDILIRTYSYTTVTPKQTLKKLCNDTPMHNYKQQFRTALIAFYDGYCNSHCVMQLPMN